MTTTVETAVPTRTWRPGPMGHDQLDSLGTTVAVWAHPDDETYLAGGLLAAMRDRAQRVVCVTATRGDAGNGLHNGGAATARRALATLRSAELDAALDVLGVPEHHWLGYTDGACEQVSSEQAVAGLLRIFAEVRPATVVSFGPDGFTGHADHRAVAGWTQRAVQRCHPRPRLLQAVTTVEDREAARDVDFRFESHGWSFPPSVQIDELTVRVVLEGAELERKVEALRQQHSQTSGLMAAVGAPRFAEWVSAESFRAA